MYFILRYTVSILYGIYSLKSPKLGEWNRESRVQQKEVSIVMVGKLLVKICPSGPVLGNIPRQECGQFISLTSLLR